MIIKLLKVVTVAKKCDDICLDLHQTFSYTNTTHGNNNKGEADKQLTPHFTLNKKELLHLVNIGFTRARVWRYTKHKLGG
jgi:Holliday junction resolvasome RuvABC DNA-binding subunit